MKNQTQYEEYAVLKIDDDLLNKTVDEVRFMKEMLIEQLQTDKIGVLFHDELTDQQLSMLEDSSGNRVRN